MEDFDAAVHFIAHYVPEGGTRFALGNDVKLRFYGLYKQATEGACARQRPGVFDVIGCKKHDAWAGNGNKSHAEAKTEYVQELTKLKLDWREWPGVAHLLFKTLDTTAPPASVAAATPTRATSDTLRAQVGVAQEIRDSLATSSQRVHEEVTSALMSVGGPLATVEPIGTPASGAPTLDRGIYDDFTNSTSSQKCTPSTFHMITKMLTPAAATAYRLLGLNYGSSPAEPPIGAARSAVSSVRTRASATSTPALPHAIRWSYSPNQAVPLEHGLHSIKLPSSDDPIAEAHAIEHTAASLAAKLDHEHLSYMCAELQLQVAKQQLLLSSAQESLEFYIGTLQGMDSSNAWSSVTPLTRTLGGDPLTQYLVSLQQTALTLYSHLRRHTFRYMILALIVILSIVIRRRIARL
jgi:diazepam-binding inhibitor (GABA receptor modulating acyl-CoA-binding protein)